MNSHPVLFHTAHWRCMDSDTVEESDMSLKTRSFLHRVNDRVAKDDGPIFKMCNARQQQTFVCLRHYKHLFSWERKYSENLRSIKNTGNNFTMKQMFDTSEKLIVGQSDEIYGVSTFYLIDSSWNHLSLIGDEEVISLSYAKVSLVREGFTVFSDSVFCLGKMSDSPNRNTVWEDKLT